MSLFLYTVLTKMLLAYILFMMGINLFRFLTKFIILQKIRSSYLESESEYNNLMDELREQMPLAIVDLTRDSIRVDGPKYLPYYLFFMVMVNLLCITLLIQYIFDGIVDLGEIFEA